MTATEIAREPVISPSAVTGSRLSLPSEDREPPLLKLRRRGRDGLFLPSPCPGDALLLGLTAPCDFVSVAVGDKNGTCSSVVNPNKKFLSRLKENAAPSACCFFLFSVHRVAETSHKSCKKKRKRNRGWFRFSADYIGLIFVSIITVSAVMGKPKD